MKLVRTIYIEQVAQLDYLIVGLVGGLLGGLTGGGGGGGLLGGLLGGGGGGGNTAACQPGAACAPSGGGGGGGLLGGLLGRKKREIIPGTQLRIINTYRKISFTNTHVSSLYFIR